MVRITIAVLALTLCAVGVYSDKDAEVDDYDAVESIREKVRNLIAMYMREAKSDEERSCIINKVNSAAQMAWSRVDQLREIMSRAPTTNVDQSSVPASTPSNPMAGVDVIVDAAKHINKIMKLAYLNFGLRNGVAVHSCLRE